MGLHPLRPAGVVDEVVDAPELGGDPIHHRPDLAVLGDVGPDGQRPGPLPPQLALGRLGRGDVPRVVDHDGRARAGESASRREPDPGRSARDHRHLAREIRHQWTGTASPIFLKVRAFPIASTRTVSPAWNSPSTAFGNQNVTTANNGFGRVRGTSQLRQIQFALKYSF